MSTAKAAVLLIFALGIAAGAIYFTTSRVPEAIFEPVIKQIDPASPSPWRDAENDMTNWFPSATRHSAKDVILSGKRADLRAELGRELRPEEMALHSYLVMSNDVHLGTVFTRRLKGAHGAIEFALAIGPERKVKSLKIQRLREPGATVSDLAKYKLERRFEGFSVTNDFVGEITGTDASAANSAREIAQAIASEVKSILVLHEAADAASNGPRPHH